MPATGNYFSSLAKVDLDDAPVAQPMGNQFFCRAPAAPPFKVPPSPAFLEELQRWWNPRSFSHHGRDARILACMRNPGDHGLDRMPPVDHCIASLVLSPDEALRKRARCSSAQCRTTFCAVPTTLQLGTRSPFVHSGGHPTQGWHRPRSRMTVGRACGGCRWYQASCLDQRPRGHWSTVGSPATPLKLGVVAAGPWDPLLRNPRDVTYGVSFRPPLPHSLRSGAVLWRELGGSPGWNGHHLAGLWQARTGAGAPPEAEAGGRGRPEGCRLTVGRFSQ
ncbi:hypothetical protein GOODEAATRI_027826 [Goodea atripinnis]|uniref:Uncharacterized protein n=1 Tax=Goodea atripinnis TaxID=208336 RepID=A0ABV0NE55_9TELE